MVREVGQRHRAGALAALVVAAVVSGAVAGAIRLPLALWSGSRAPNVFVDTITIMYGLSGQSGILRTRLLEGLEHLVGGPRTDLRLELRVRSGSVSQRPYGATVHPDRQRQQPGPEVLGQELDDRVQAHCLLTRGGTPWCVRAGDNSTDPKIVAAAFGMDAQGAMFYLTDQVDQDRLTDSSQRWRDRFTHRPGRH